MPVRDRLRVVARGVTVTLRVGLFGDFGYHDLYKQFELNDDAVIVVKRGLGFNARVAVAAAVLRDHHHQVTERNVIVMAVSNAPGALAPALRLMGEAYDDELDAFSSSTITPLKSKSVATILQGEIASK